MSTEADEFFGHFDPPKNPLESLDERMEAVAERVSEAADTLERMSDAQSAIWQELRAGVLYKNVETLSRIANLLAGIKLIAVAILCTLLVLVIR